MIAVEKSNTNKIKYKKFFLFTEIKRCQVKNGMKLYIEIQNASTKVQDGNVSSSLSASIETPLQSIT